MRQLAPRIASADRGSLRRLASLPADEGLVLTFYVNLDPTDFGTAPARETQLTSLFNQAADEVARVNASHDVRAAAESDLERVRDALRIDDTWAKEATAALVVCSTHAGIFEILRLPLAVGPLVFVDDHPRLDLVASLLSTTEWGILLVNRSTARIVRVSNGIIRETDEQHDDVHGRHSQGGWSQARYERSVERDVQIHLQAAAQRMFDAHSRLAFDRILVATPEELWPEVQRSLHPYLVERLAGRFDVDVENSTVEEIEAAAEPGIAQHDAERERAALDRLAEGLGRGERAVAGTDDVWRALQELRVEILLLDDAHGHAVEMMKALQQAADVLVVADPTALGGYGGIAAILRY